MSEHKTSSIHKKHHRAIKLTPYQAVETAEQQSEKEMQEKADDDDSTSTTDKAEDMEMRQKKQQILENQRKYNNDMIQQTKTKNKNEKKLRYQAWCQSK